MSEAEGPRPQPTRPMRTAFLSLPGLCTGDLWHTAAAGLLLQQKPFPPDVRYVVLITLPQDARPELLSRHVAAMYHYLTNVGLTCVVAKLPPAGVVDDGHCERAAATISPEQMGEIFAARGEHGETGAFQVVWDSLSPVRLLQPGPTATAGKYILPPIHHYAATSIMMTFFKRGAADHDVHSYLRRTMTGDLPPKSPIHLDAQSKVQQLRELISRKRKDVGPGFEHARAVLFIYRNIEGARGPSNQFVMNPHQNASHDLFDQVRQAALRHGLITVRLPHGLPSELINENDLDLFDGLLRDKRFTASFWAQVYDMPEVYGSVGGRTGSLDIAAILGVNCFEWDEPLLHEVQNKKFATGWNQARLSRQHLEEQIPQHLRLLTQGNFMSIGLLSEESFSDGCYTRIDEETLESWLAGQRDIFPRLPSDQETVGRTKKRIIPRIMHHLTDS